MNFQLKKNYHKIIETVKLLKTTPISMSQTTIPTTNRNIHRMKCDRTGTIQNFGSIVKI